MVKYRTKEELDKLLSEVYGENSKARMVTMRELGLLGVDSDNQLYWEGKPVKIEKKISLNWFQGVLATLTAVGAFLSGIIALFNYWGI